MSRGGKEAWAGEAGVLYVPVAGLTLVSLLIVLAVGSVLMGRAAETWDSQVRHELEEDLIFRGEEYQRAIEDFQRTNGRLPMKLEELCPKEKTDHRYIRRCWKDPITGKEMRLIAPGEEGARKLRNEERNQQGDGESEGGRSRDPLALSSPGESLLGGFGRRRKSPSPTTGPALSQIRFSLPGQASREQLSGEKPIRGVASDSDRTGFRTYQESSIYSEWEFLATQAGPQSTPSVTPPPGGPTPTPPRKR